MTVTVMKGRWLVDWGWWGPVSVQRDGKSVTMRRLVQVGHTLLWC